MASTRQRPDAPLAMDRRLFCAILAWRCACAMAISTYFNPDEYWQSLEVAHEMVFGCVLFCAS